MNLDEFRSQLRDAGRPVQLTIDPIPVIRKRARRVRRRRAAVAVCMLALIAGVSADLAGSFRMTAPPEPATTVTASPQPPYSAQMALLPQRLGDRIQLETVSLGTTGSTQADLRPGDVVRLAYSCVASGDAGAVDSPPMLSVYPPGLPSAEPALSVPLVECAGPAQVASLTLPRDWLPGTATVAVETPPNRTSAQTSPRLLGTRVGIYRVQP